MKKRLLPVFLLILTLLFSSCANRQELSCDAVLSKILATCGETQERSGQIYLLHADEGEIEYFSRESKALMYGERAAEQYFPKIEDCAIYVSARVPEEIAIFKCYSASDTDGVAKMCLERADMIKVALRNSSWEEKSDGIRVIVHRRFVALIFTEEPERLESKLRSLI